MKLLKTIVIPLSVYSCKKKICHFDSIILYLRRDNSKKTLLKQSMKGGDKLENRAISQKKLDII
jgi:hypothetical protein